MRARRRQRHQRDRGQALSHARAARCRDLQTAARRCRHRRRITDAKVIDARLLDGISARELERRLVGRRIRSTERHGKHLIAELDDRSALILHFGMTGTIETSAEGAATPRYEVLHIGLGKDRWASVTSRRKLGHIWLTGDVATFLKDHSQGPDALAKTLDAEAFATALGSKRSALKVCTDGPGAHRRHRQHLCGRDPVPGEAASPDSGRRSRPKPAREPLPNDGTGAAPGDRTQPDGRRTGERLSRRLAERPPGTGWPLSALQNASSHPQERRPDRLPLPTLPAQAAARR